ncbi:hypothetical protein HETIRDRAFT_324952 [Heterobasidion irregulare TC 32-1]|uniref:Uncharacterized protein n=1 Tax=Heterobasidion irregulare (strain TC 32-1) TaxID=747525 RepID=W4JVW9_HETIT|nr:uncharacterized protein HETIRDRAFT_324952 [Heterobasidion irregulare TC 32-1]ETW77708.1 hypothetical protein HETIRDRAFT_324952 [Heterobasidion irregulare TC 32-1]
MHHRARSTEGPPCMTVAQTTAVGNVPPDATMPHHASSPSMRSVRRTPHAARRAAPHRHRSSVSARRPRPRCCSGGRAAARRRYFRCADDGSVDPARVLRGADHPDP